MLTRREVLESGAALIASPVALSVSAAHRRPGRQGAQPRAFLVDARSADALAIAELMAARGVRVREYRSDLSEIP